MHLLKKWELCSPYSVFPSKMLRYGFSTLWNKALKSNSSTVVENICQILATSDWHFPFPRAQPCSNPLQLGEITPKTDLLSLTHIPIPAEEISGGFVGRHWTHWNCFFPLFHFLREKIRIIWRCVASHRHVMQGTSLTPWVPRKPFVL